MRIQVSLGVSIIIVSVAIILGFAVRDVHAGRSGGGSIGGGGGGGRGGGGSPRFIAPPLIPSLLFGNRKNRCRPEMIVIAGAVGDECRKKALGPLRSHGNGVRCEPMRRSKSVSLNTRQRHDMMNAIVREVADEDENEVENRKANFQIPNINSNNHTSNNYNNTNISNNTNNITSTNNDINNASTSNSYSHPNPNHLGNVTMTEVVIECVCVWSTDCFFEKIDNGERSSSSRNTMHSLDFLSLYASLYVLRFVLILL